MIHILYLCLVLLVALLAVLGTMRLYSKPIASGTALECLVAAGWSLVRTGDEWSVMAGTQVLTHSPSAQLAISQAAAVAINAQKEAGRA